MRRTFRFLALAPLLGAGALAALAALPGAPEAAASSHSEAPGTAADRATDCTDVYAFTSPDAPTTVTLVANYFPLEEPSGGPELLRLRRRRALRDPRRQRRRRGRGRDVPVRVHDHDEEPGDVPLQHVADHVRRRAPTRTRGSTSSSATR